MKNRLKLPAAAASIATRRSATRSSPNRHLAYADTPITRSDEDLLDFVRYADAIAELIDNEQTYTPLTLAISAPWGSGKTSLANLVAERLVDWPVLRGEREHVVCWFYAWLHDDAPHLGAAFAADVAKAAGRERSLFRRVINPIPSQMLSPHERWHRRLAVAAAALLVALPSAFVPGLRQVFTDHGIDAAPAFGASLTSLTAAATLLYLVWAKLFAIAQSASSYVADPGSEATRGSMVDVRNQLGKILAQAARRRRIVIFVDDLERCRPPRAVEVCEVATQLLAHPNVIVILLADMPAIAAAAAIKYAQLEGRYRPGGDVDSPAQNEAYGRSYLEKIVQLQFEIPRHPDLVKRLIEAELGSGP